MNKKIIPLLVAGTAIIAGCNQQGTPTTSNSTSTATTAAVVNKADAIAVVNGQYISKDALAKLEKDIAERSHGQKFPKEKLIEELVQRELLIQDATQKQLDKSPEVAEALENAKRSLLSQADLKKYIESNPVTDAEIKAEYDSKVAGENGTEYKARHILVKTEDEAKKLLAELGKGADFAKLANKHSLDAKESQNGGDLGWFVASQMVAPFSEALVKLEKGKYTQAPVKTQFGYHIILREDSRAQTPPPLETVKEQLLPFLQRQKVQTMIEGLRKQAKVEILVPLTDEQPKADATAAPAAAPAAANQSPATVEQKADNAAAVVDKAAEATVEAAKTAEQTTEKAVEKAATQATEAIKAVPAEVKK